MWYLFLCLLLFLTSDIAYQSSSPTSSAISMCCLVCYVFIFRFHLTFVIAVTLILKHATFLQTSKPSKAVLTHVDLDYQRANIDGSIQQYLTACTSDVSVEQFACFIMGTEIGLLTLFPFVTSISYCPSSFISVHSCYRCIDDTAC